MWLLLLDGRLSRLEGALCLVALVAYGVLNVVLARRESADEAVQDFETGIPGRKSNPVLAVLWVMGGLGLLLVGSSLLLANAVTLARALGVGEAVIGLTLVAAGTSLPELATSMLAAARNQPDLAIGNVVGSNLFNLLGILGCTAVISPIAAPGISPLDLGMLAATAMGLQGLLWTELRLQRWEGAALVGLYGFYLWWLWPP
jgi:cation:H+ antiporter